MRPQQLHVCVCILILKHKAKIEMNSKEEEGDEWFIYQWGDSICHKIFIIALIKWIFQLNFICSEFLILSLTSPLSRALSEIIIGCESEKKSILLHQKKMHSQFVLKKI